MDSEKLNIDTIFNHWIETSNNDYNTMVHLYESKDYHWSLFIGHLVIEKLLKAFIVKETQKHAPFTHDLRRLAKLTNINFEKEHILWFDVITTFNLNARYDNYKKRLLQ
jgi:HEPN domain-containing protein